MPIFNWNKYRDTNKGKYLIKDVNSANKITKFIMNLFFGLRFLITKKSFNKSIYNNAWNKLYQQYIDKFGYDESFKEVLKLKIERFKKMTDFMINEKGNRKKFTITEINLLNMQIEEIEKNIPKSERVDFESNKVYVDKWLSSVLDDKKVSVVQYQYYINEMSKPQKTA